MILLVSGDYVITNEFLFRNAVSDEIYIVCDTSSGPVNVTLPKINQEYMNGEFYISDGSSNAATNNINILVDGTDLINGASGIVLDTDNSCCSIFVASSSDTGDDVVTPKSMWIAAKSTGGGGGGTYGANNGLNLVGTNFKLGGTLLANTTILNNGFDFVVSRNTVGGDAIKGINIDGAGVRGQSTSSVGIVGISSSNSGVSGVSTTGQAITGTVSSTTANDIKTILRLNNSKSSPSNGIGAAIDFFVGTSFSPQVLAGKLGLLWTDVNNSTRKSKFFVSNVNNGLEENKLEVESTGQIIFNKYGTATPFTGTPAYLLGVDASGNVIEETPSQGGLLDLTGLLSFTDGLTSVGVPTASYQVNGSVVTININSEFTFDFSLGAGNLTFTPPMFLGTPTAVNTAQITSRYNEVGGSSAVGFGSVVVGFFPTLGDFSIASTMQISVTITYLKA